MPQARARVAAAEAALTRAEQLHERPDTYRACADGAAERARTELAEARTVLEEAERRRRDADARTLAYTAPTRNQH